MATLGYKPPQTTARTSVSFDALQEASRCGFGGCRRLVEMSSRGGHRVPETHFVGIHNIVCDIRNLSQIPPMKVRRFLSPSTEFFLRFEPPAKALTSVKWSLEPSGRPIFLSRRLHPLSIGEINGDLNPHTRQ